MFAMQRMTRRVFVASALAAILNRRCRTFDRMALSAWLVLPCARDRTPPADIHCLGDAAVRGSCRHAGWQHRTAKRCRVYRLLAALAQHGTGATSVEPVERDAREPG